MSKNQIFSPPIFSLLAAFVLYGASSLPVVGQDNQEKPPMTTETAALEEVPPPIVALSHSERQQLNSETDYKKRTQLCLEFADSRLQRAQTLADNAEYQNALSELGGYRALIEQGVNFLKASGSNKAQNNLKKLEMAMRRHAPLLESIRRVTPFEYALHVKSVMTFARETRSRALESFFGETVVATGEGGDSASNGGIKAAPAAATGGSGSAGFGKKP